MKILANRLMNQARGIQVGDEAPPFQAESRQIDYRIGVWPLLDNEQPEVAMGLMSALALLLERRRSAIVYRLFVALEDNQDDIYEWDISQSQFTIDDWQLDELDENIAVWGTLAREDGRWKLALELESDLSESDEIIALDYDAGTLHELIALLPTAAADIFARLSGTPAAQIDQVYRVGALADESFGAILSAAFRWERDLLLYLWDVEWSAEQIRADLAAMVATAQSLEGDEFCAWLAAGEAVRLLNRAAPDLAEVLIEPAQQLVDQLAHSALPAVVMGRALAELDRIDEAVDLIEATVVQHPDSVAARTALIDIYRRDNRLPELVSALQGALEDGVADVGLHLRYGDLLIALHQAGSQPPRFLYIDAQDYQPQRVLEEAVQAYQHAIDLSPDHLRALQRQLMLQLELKQPEFVDNFTRLVAQDSGGEHVRGVVDELHLLEEPEPLARVLEDALEAQPDRHDLRVNLAVVYLGLEREDEALELLEEAEEMVDDPAVLADIERLLLAASDPDFEYRLGEIIDILNAGKIASLDDIDFLEAVVEDAPSFAQGYLLLAQAYRSRSNDGAALETLLDGQKVLPRDPDITEMLARTLWSAGEHQLAFDYLNKGLAHNPDAVSLLALTGRGLFEEGQQTEARLYLLRAESLDPRNRVLIEAKRFIAGLLNGAE